MVNIPVMAMFFGIIGTVQLHLAKAMEKHGIEIFDRIEAKLRRKEAENGENNGGMKKPLIYTAGMLLHNTVFIWQMLGTSYGLASHVTSMFGLGLIVLLFYSSAILKEEISRVEYAGAAVLITGTLIIGLENINQQFFDRTTINATAAILFFVSFILTGIIIIRFALRTSNPFTTGILFGVFAGGCGCLDPVFKELGLVFGGNATKLLPVHPFGWLLYFSSFAIGFIGLAFTQWGFARKAKASVLVPAYNSVYVTLPVILQVFTFPDYFPSWITLLGITITVTGIFMMQVFKKSEENLSGDDIEKTHKT